MTDEKPLKRYRSHAERVAVCQRYVQIALTTLVVVLQLLIACGVIR